MESDRERVVLGREQRRVSFNVWGGGTQQCWGAREQGLGLGPRGQHASAKTGAGSVAAGWLAGLKEGRGRWRGVAGKTGVVWAQPRARMKSYRLRKDGGAALGPGRRTQGAGLARARHKEACAHSGVGRRRVRRQPPRLRPGGHCCALLLLSLCLSPAPPRAAGWCASHTAAPPASAWPAQPPAMLSRIASSSLASSTSWRLSAARLWRMSSASSAPASSAPAGAPPAS